MKKTFVIMMVVVFSICIGAWAVAQEKKGEALPKAAASAPKPKTVKERVITKTATVEAIDLQTRLVTLKDKDNNFMNVKVSENVKNLPQVKVGDQVTAKYYESVAFELAAPETAMQVGTSSSASKAKLGERPAGVETKIVSTVVTIQAIDSKKNVATLKGPDDKIVNVKILDPKKWESAKAGDKLRITFTEALAIEVKPSSKK